MGSEIRNDPGMRGQNASQRAARLATRQYGAIARRQLLAIGVSSTRVERWLGGGRLFLRYPGVYAYGRPDLSPQGELAAALLHAGPGAALSGLTALWWLELLNRRPALIEIDAPGKRTSRQDLLIRHPAEVRRAPHRGLPTVPIERALLCAAGSLSPDSLRLVLARAEFRKLISLRAVDLAASEGRRGSRKLRAALDSHLPQLARCTNGLERDFVLLCERYRLPLPEPNPRIGRYRPDMLWRDARLIVELDGKDAHSTAAQLTSDQNRQVVLEGRGHTVIRFTAAKVDHESDHVAARVAHHLGL